MSDLPHELHDLSIAEAARLIQARSLSPVELTRHLLERIETLDPLVNAFITVTADHALDQARAAEKEVAAGRYRGPLHGIAFGLKDIYNTAGILTTGHSKLGMTRVPVEDAATARRLYDAGGVLVGKLATYEFAHGGHSEHTPWPAPRNPWNLDFATGGSSSGSAAAVAAGFIPAALGSDTGGSIRIPAAATGIAGLKPTYGLVSRRGAIPNSFSFDHCGPMARTVEDCALMLQALAGFDPQDPASALAPVPDYRLALVPGLKGLRVGVLRHFWEEDLTIDDEAVRAIDAALDVLSHLGAQVEDARMAPVREYDDVKIVIAETETFAIHAQQLASRLNDFGVEFLRKTLAGCLFDAAAYVSAQRQRRGLLEQMESLYARYDVLVTASGNPAQRVGVYAVLNAWKTPGIHTPFSVTAGPALALCTGYTAAGLPLAMQIAGRPFDDAAVLRVGHAYEQATQWRSRRPGITPKTSRPAQVARFEERESPDAAPAIRDAVAYCVRHAGLALSPQQFAQVCEFAPHALDMAQRVRRAHPRELAPANVLGLG